MTDNTVQMRLVCGDRDRYASTDNGISDIVDSIEDLDPLLSMCGAILINDSAAVIKQASESVWLEIQSSADDFILYFIEHFIKYRKNDCRQAYKVVSIAKMISVSDVTLNRIYAMYNWGGIEKGEKYYDAIMSFSETLRQMVFDGKASMQSSYYFYMRFSGEQYDDLLDRLSGLTFSEISQSLQWIIEISKRSSDNASTLANLTDMLGGLNSAQIVDKLTSIRYPAMTSMTDKYQSFVDSLGLSHRVKPSCLLEKQSYTLSVQFRDCADLAKQLDSIGHKLEKVSSDDDMFILDNLTARTLEN